MTKYDDTEILSLLATGVSLLSNPAPARLPQSLELGLQYLQALAWERTSQPLTADWLWWEKFEYPIGDWWPGGLQSLPVSAAGSKEGLLRFTQPTPLCQEWAIQKRYSLQDQLAEIDEKVMYEIWRECRVAELQDLYVSTRRYLIENPVVREDELVSEIALGRLHGLANKAYGPLPPSCIKNGMVYLCPHCGDAQRWSEDGATCRNWAICQTLPAHEPIPRPAINLLRCKPGIFSYVVSPGLPELELYKKLNALGLDVQLWPGVDAFDLLVTLPDPQAHLLRWAIDVKQFREGYTLGRSEQSKEFIPCPPELEWDRAWYVIPHFYVDSYPELFCRGAGITPDRLAAWKIQITSIPGLLKEISLCAT